MAGIFAAPSARVRLRLALGVVLLLVVPLAAAGWVLDHVAGSGDRARVNQSLVQTLDAAHRALAARLGGAASRAAKLAAETPIQSALLHRDTARLMQIAATRGASIVVDGRRVAGPPPSPLAERAVVVSGRRQLGQIVVSVPVDARSLAQLEQQTLVRPATRLALVRGGRIVASDTLSLGTRLSAPARRVDTVDVGGVRYLAIAVGVGAASVQIVALAPDDPLASTSSHRRLWLLVAILATLATAALAAAIFAPALPRNLSRSAREERRRTRHPVTVIGEVLASTHDRSRLLQVLLATTMEVTGSAGGRVVEGNSMLITNGDTRGPRRLELSLDPEGETRLVLHAPPEGFEPGGTALARSIVAQGRIALENARLHRLAEEQAVTDDLTGLANRRQFLYRLELELQRSERMDEPLAIVFADLDHFKDVNDRFGHDAGDEVLRLFATVLRDHSRTIDLPARLGGEEFAVLLPGTDAEGARTFAERVRTTTEELRPPTADGSVRVTASFGIASSAISLTRQELLNAADAALYHAKASGRNTVTIA
jgi:diguanylate cyclase (GGDEF)-like protein